MSVWLLLLGYFHWSFLTAQQSRPAMQPLNAYCVAAKIIFSAVAHKGYVNTRGKTPIIFWYTSHQTSPGSVVGLYYCFCRFSCNSCYHLATIAVAANVDDDAIAYISYFCIYQTHSNSHNCFQKKLEYVNGSRRDRTTSQINVFQGMPPSPPQLVIQ